MSTFNDVVFYFQSASGLPKMDMVGNGDPYFVASLEGKVEYMYDAASFTRKIHTYLCGHGADRQ